MKASEKPRLKAIKATVPVTSDVIDENDEKSKNNLNYELIKESAGWRVSDIKSNNESMPVGTIKNLQKTFKESDEELDGEFKSHEPPFVGIRSFVTNKGGSGTGNGPEYYFSY